MNEKDRLLKWMADTGFDTGTLAQALGVSYSTIYMQTKSDRPVSAETKWSFALCFGMDEARKIFDVAPEVQP